MACEQAKKYETENVQKRVKYEYYYSCLNTIWPGHICHHHVLAKGEHYYFKDNSFKKGQILTIHNNQLLTAPKDGHVFSEAGKLSFVFYPEDKPPMKLDVLKSLPWPEYKDVLAFRNSRIINDVQISRRNQQLTPNAKVTIDSKKGMYLTFAQLKVWVQLRFKFSKYDPAETERLFDALKLFAPNVALFWIRKDETMTNVLPLYPPYTLIQPNSTIAYIYDPAKLSLLNNVSSPKPRYSTIIAELSHQGSIYCLALEFDLRNK